MLIIPKCGFKENYKEKTKKQYKFNTFKKLGISNIQKLKHRKSSNFYIIKSINLLL